MKISKFISRNREISAGFLIFMILVVSVLVASNHSPKPVVEEFEQQANFVIASWDYPDQHGQGIYMIRFYENSTGSWVAAPWYYVGGALDGLPFYSLHEYDPYTLNWSAGVAMKIRVYTTLNESLVGVATTAEGQQYLQHDVVVSNPYETVFSQQNFTYYDATDGGDLYVYEYEVVLNFIPQQFTTYTIDLTHEIYFEGAQSGGQYLHDCSDTSDITYDSDNGLDPADYGIGSNGSVVEIWIVPDSVADESVRYKLEFVNVNNTNGDVNITTRYRVEDGYTAFRFVLYYTDTTYDTQGMVTSQNWINISIDADSGKTLDYAILWCDDNPSSVTSGNRSVYVDFVEITSETGSLTYILERWNLVSTSTIYFNVEMEEELDFIFGSLLIFFGLCLVPTSTLYLVYGGRKHISIDKLFFALIVFIIGWALVIGGVMP